MGIFKNPDGFDSQGRPTTGSSGETGEEARTAERHRAANSGNSDDIGNFGLGNEMISVPNGRSLIRPADAMRIDARLASVVRCKRCGNWNFDGEKCLCPKNL